MSKYEYEVRTEYGDRNFVTSLLRDFVRCAKCGVEERDKGQGSEGKCENGVRSARCDDRNFVTSLFRDFGKKVRGARCEVRGAKIVISELR
jgi:hypothetical protein